jgi:hypothetical protein
MAAPPRLISLNIGSQTIGLAEFRVIQGRLVLQSYRFREMPIDPAGERRDAHVAVHETDAALREMMHEMHINRAQPQWCEIRNTVFSWARTRFPFHTGPAKV